MKRFKDLKVGDKVFIYFEENGPGSYEVDAIKTIEVDEVDGDTITTFTTEGGRDFEFDDDEFTIEDTVLGDPVYADSLIFYADVEPLIHQLKFEITCIEKTIKELEKYNEKVD